MSRVSDWRLREYLVGLELDPSEVVEMLEITVEELCTKFPTKVRANIGKFGFEDIHQTEDE